MTHLTDFNITSGQGQATPTFVGLDLLPEFIDDSAGATDARRAWIAANATGAAAHAAWIAKRTAFREANPRRAFVDLDAYVHACDRHLEDDTAAVAVLTRASVKALQHYWTSQRANPVNVREVARMAFLEEDAKARAAFAEAERAFLAREQAARYIGVRAEENARPGFGSFVHSVTLAHKSPDAIAQRDAFRVCIEVAPRALVAQARAEAAKGGKA